MNDPYIDPASGILRNRLGITNGDRLREVEAGFTRTILAILVDDPVPGTFDLDHLQAWHRRIFGRIYPWAGEIRTVAIAKTDMFCLPQHIETYAHSVFDELAKEKHLRGLGRQEFVDRLTHYFAEINAIHPFREGNGRTQRAFFGQLSREAGWPVDWSDLDPQANIDASIASLRGDNDPLWRLLNNLTAAR